MSYAQTFREAAGADAYRVPPAKVQEPDMLHSFLEGKATIEELMHSGLSDEDLMTLPHDVAVLIKPDLEAVFKGYEKVVAANDQLEFKRQHDHEDKNTKEREEQQREIVAHWNKEEVEFCGEKMTRGEEAEHVKDMKEHFADIWKFGKENGLVDPSKEVETKQKVDRLDELLKLGPNISHAQKAERAKIESDPAVNHLNEAMAQLRALHTQFEIEGASISVAEPAKNQEVKSTLSSITPAFSKAADGLVVAEAAPLTKPKTVVMANKESAYGI